VSWVLIRDVTQPSPAQPGSRAPGAPTPPCAPSSSLSLSFGFPVQQPLSPSPTSLSPWCPRDWRRRSPEFGPRGELPSPPFSSLSPSLPLPPLSPCARPLFSPLRARASLCDGATPRPSPSPSSAGAAPPLRSPAALGPSPSLPVRPGPSPAALGPPLLPGPPARPCAGAARRGRVPGASATRRGRGPCVARGLCAGAARRVASAPATRLRPLRAASTPRRATVLAPLRRVRISD
jgi:hypothetical protein